VSGGVAMRGLRKAYREGGVERRVLDGLSGEAAGGELVALLARSGAGKTTLLNLLSGVDRPDAGTIAVDGVELTALSESERTRFRRRRIGIVFQAFNLLPTLTVLENAMLRLSLDGRADAAAEAAALKLLGEVGLADRAESFPDRLSGGEQQRVAVAAALVHEPALVLADEPTGNLDEGNARIVLGLLERLARGAGATLIIATHAPEVARLADRTWTIQGGALA
jgi:putative ABC transport system ATP-binding protein